MECGNAPSLARAERSIGLKSWSIAYKKDPYNYPFDEVMLSEEVSVVDREWARFRLLKRAIFDFDIIHFNFGLSIMPQWNPEFPSGLGIFKSFYHKVYTRVLEYCDLPLLKSLGKGIMVTYQGSDARQADYCREHFPITFVNEVDPKMFSVISDINKRRCIAIFERYADRIYAVNPDLLNVLPEQAAFLPYSNVDITHWHPRTAMPFNPNCPLILHAPSDRNIKGTKYIVKAIERLKAEGLQFEFMLIENMSNAQARQIYERADIVIDQLLAGWYGGLAVEIMALGKPVICYLRESDFKFIPEGMRNEMPVINANPSTIYEVLKYWLTENREKIPELGKISRSYVERWHDPGKIAEGLKRDYEKTMLKKRINR
jgi:glycosyltransferase involved in cell wall biosynthesis